jgi:hypothetical protein
VVWQTLRLLDWRAVTVRSTLTGRVVVAGDDAEELALPQAARTAEAPTKAAAVSSRTGTSLLARPKRSKLAAVGGREPVFG